jgi:hypothetical protein
MKNFISTAILVFALFCPIFSDQLSEETILPIKNNLDAYTPASAYGDEVFLVVWQSGRFSVNNITQGFEPIADLVACRINKSGEILDHLPFIISSANDLQEQPRVAFGNGIFLVVWQDLRNGVDWDVYATRVTSAGVVLDPDGILVCGGANNQALPSVTWDGNNFWVVWSDYRSKGYYEIFGGRVSSSGEVLDSSGVLVTSRKGTWCNVYRGVTTSRGAGKSFTLSVTKVTSADGWKTPTSIGKFMVNGMPSGDSLGIHYKIDKNGPDANSNPLYLAASPTNYMAVWRTDFTAGGRGGSPTGSTAAIFDSAGQRILSFHLSSTIVIGQPVACWDDTLGFVAAWQQNGAAAKTCPFDVVKLVKATKEGVPNSTVHAISGTMANPAGESSVAASGDGVALVAYERHPSVASDPIKIGFRTLTYSPSTASEFAVSASIKGTLSAYPVPFKNSITINYALSSKKPVNLSIVDIKGQIVRNIGTETKETGSHLITLDRAALSDGVYFVRLSIDGNQIMKKITLLK